MIFVEGKGGIGNCVVETGFAKFDSRPEEFLRIAKPITKAMVYAGSNQVDVLLGNSILAHPVLMQMIEGVLDCEPRLPQITVAVHTADGVIIEAEVRGG